MIRRRCRDRWRLNGNLSRCADIVPYFGLACHVWECGIFVGKWLYRNYSCYTLLLPEDARCILRTSWRKAANVAATCWTRQIQASPNQLWAQCSGCIPPPATRGPDMNPYTDSKSCTTQVLKSIGAGAAKYKPPEYVCYKGRGSAWDSSVYSVQRPIPVLHLWQYCLTEPSCSIFFCVSWASPQLHLQSKHDFSYCSNPPGSPSCPP